MRMRMSGDSVGTEREEENGENGEKGKPCRSLSLTLPRRHGVEVPLLAPEAGKAPDRGTGTGRPH